MSSTRPPRDPIVQRSPDTAGGRPKRSDLLNGKPRTTTPTTRGPNFTKASNTRREAGWPVPNSPYGDD